jgi:acyl carrier protein
MATGESVADHIRPKQGGYMPIIDTVYSDRILTQLRQLIAGIPGCFLDFAEIRREHHLREDLGLDSLAMVDLMVAIEDTMGVYFDPIQMDLDAAFETVGTLAGVITALTAGGNPEVA